MRMQPIHSSPDVVALLRADKETCGRNALEFWADDVQPRLYPASSRREIDLRTSSREALMAWSALQVRDETVERLGDLTLAELVFQRRYFIYRQGTKVLEAA